MYNSYAYYTSVVIAILSPVAVAGNALVLAAIWRSSSLRKPFYILLAGLAFTDFSNGILTQPVYVSIDFFPLTETELKIMTAVANGCAIFLSSMNLLILTIMSIERWLQMTRRSLVTAKKTCLVVVALLFVAIPVTVFRVLYASKGTHRLQSSIYIISMLLVCLVLTSAFYLTIFRMIRRHQQQIQANESTQNFGQPAINFAKYKRSVFSILYILAVFYSSFLPISISIVLIQVLNNPEFTKTFFDVAMVFLFLSSTLNPLVYLWRMRDLRNEVAQLVKRILCKEN